MIKMIKKLSMQSYSSLNISKDGLSKSNSLSKSQTKKLLDKIMLMQKDEIKINLELIKVLIVNDDFFILNMWKQMINKV